MPPSKPPGEKPDRPADTRSAWGAPVKPDAARGAPADANSGNVTHDTRGNAVWRWAASVGAHVIESTSRLLRRLEVPELKVDEKPKGLELEERNPGGGYDPYNSRTKSSDRKR